MKRKSWDFIDWGFALLVFIAIAIGALIGVVVYNFVSNIPSI